MDELAYIRARREAQELLDAHWDGEFPVKLGPITDALDAVKYEMPLDGGISGVVSKQPRGAAEIVLNSAEPAPRRRFTWAHELGHVVERSSVASDEDFSITDARGSDYNLHEFFADEFAGALLMPKNEIHRLEGMAYSIAQQARHFGVSLPAVRQCHKRLSSQPDPASI
ncbi:hypothetical protein GCM10009720_27550 [Yaniella flava]|uniref:IrrE N-terminal-like domain-containing protein n=1 Tax=Yaniella flava TaxID=287930 RepID=A0ABP5GIV3_9MICC